jgi:hypothetical protein
MSANIDQLAPTKSLIDLTRYTSDEFVLPDHIISSLFDDLILVEFTDVSQDGTAVKRGDLWVPLNTAPRAWRVGRILVKGNRCKNIDVNQMIIFPGDKGVPISNIQYYDDDKKVQTVKHGIFLNEDRLFGACVPDDR